MKPVLFQDVDGVLLVKHEVEGYESCSIDDVTYWYAPETPERMKALNRLFNIVWASHGWRGREDKYLSPLFGLPTELPMLEFSGVPDSNDMLPAKLKAIEAYTQGPSAICDDKMGSAVELWAVGRTCLLVQPDASVGMVEKQFNLLRAFGEMYLADSGKKMLAEFGFIDVPQAKAKAFETAWLKLHGRNEKPFVDACKRFIQGQVGTILGYLDGMPEAENIGRDLTADDLFDPRKWDDSLRDLAEPHIKRSIYAGAMIAWQRHGKSAEAYAKVAEASRKDGVLMEIPLRVQERIQRQIDESLTRLVDNGSWPDVNDTTRQKLSFLIQESLLDGDSSMQLARRISREMGPEWAGMRALRIARTECLPSETIVDGALITAAYRRWYEGPMVKIVTDAGREFTGTPNHPMLTIRGWVALGNLTKNDRLIAYSSNIKQARSSRNMDEEAPPASIGQIFNSLSTFIKAERNTTTQIDFHGDGMDGDVEILRPDSPLTFREFIPIDELSVDGLLSPSDLKRLVATAKSNPFDRGIAVNARHTFIESPEDASISFDASGDACFIDSIFCSKPITANSGCVIGENIGNRELLVATESGSHQDFSGLLECSHGNSESLTAACNSAGVTSEFIRKGNSAGSGRIKRRNLPGLIVTKNEPVSIAPGDAASVNLSSDNTNSAIEPFSDFNRPDSGQIEIDNLLSISVIQDWSGHVYNLSTVDGYFSANGLYTGNTTGALNSGQLAVIEDLENEGIASKAIWLAVLDEHTRATHWAADHQEADAEGFFDIGRHKARFPGDPDLPVEEIANCRCALSSK